jgi:hypothetical protein
VARSANRDENAIIYCLKQQSKPQTLINSVKTVQVSYARVVVRSNPEDKDIAICHI